MLPTIYYFHLNFRIERLNWMIYSSSEQKPMHCCSNLKKANHFYSISSIIYLSCNVIWQNTNTIFSSVNTLIILNVPKYPDSPDSPTYNFKLNFVEDPMHHEDGLISVKLYDFNINTIFRYKYDILRLANLKYYLIRK